MDIVSRKKRSQMMAGIRSCNTTPELLVRHALHARGFRYRLGTKVLGTTPDIVLRKYRVAIFVHGCFWHRHADCRYATTPATRTDWWLQKFARNVERDAAVTERLVREGWRVVVIWECWSKRKLALEWLYEWITASDAPLISWPKVADLPHADESGRG